MEALENKLALPILILPDPLLGIVLLLLAMEHMTTQVEHSLLIHFGSLTVYKYHTWHTFAKIILVVVHKLVHSFYETYFVHLLLEFWLAEIGQGYQQVHQHAHLHGMLYELQDAVHYEDCLLGVVRQFHLAPLRMDHVCQHCRGEILAEHMDLGLEATLHQFEHPLDEPTLDVSSNQILLDRTLLQYAETEPLRNIAVLLLQQYIDNLLNNHIIIVISYILDPFYRRHDN